LVPAFDFAVAAGFFMVFFPLRQTANSRFHFTDSFINLCVFQLYLSLFVVPAGVASPELPFKLIVPRVISYCIELRLFAIEDIDDAMGDVPIGFGDIVLEEVGDVAVLGSGVGL
jgi:hypothetical protein